MKWTTLFSALERRFDSFNLLKTKARKLYGGLEGQAKEPAPPYVDVTCEDEQELSTFGTDIYQYRLKFTAFARSMMVDEVAGMMDAIRVTFDRANLRDGLFGTAGFAFVNQSGPVLDGGKYKGDVTFDVIVQKNTLTRTPLAV